MFTTFRASSRQTVWALVLLVGLTAVILARPSQQPVSAAPAFDAAPAADLRLMHQDLMLQAGKPGDLSCRLCHSDTEQEITLPSGESLSLRVDLAALDRSVHGRTANNPLLCADCHRPASDYRFPHAPMTAGDLAAYRLARSTSCEHCHTPHLTGHPGPDAATPVLCADCHTGHEVANQAAWHSGAAVSACLDCHEPNDGPRLTGLIQAGMFAAEPTDLYCLACHSQPDMSMTLANGDLLSLTIDPNDVRHSVHGEGNSWGELTCVNCHEGYLYPHEPVTAGTAREYALEKYPVCATCHVQNYSNTMDNVHGLALASGNLEAAMCTDCHGAHAITKPNEPRERISYTCEQCHTETFAEYAASVHGAALIADSNPDVPTCTDCHGVHDIADPTTAQFRLNSPQLCAQCHLDEEKMGRYDISTDVYNTYVADFHGTTVTLFHTDDPTIGTNAATCTDCHGVHNILSAKDPEKGLSIRENLLVTCQECHPNATANFSDAWTSHHRPSLEHNVLAYLVITFYQIFIPLVLGFLGFLVLTDIYRRVRMRLRPGS